MLVATAATVQEQIGLGAQLELGPTRRHRAQDRPVASAEGVRGGHGGLALRVLVVGISNAGIGVQEILTTG